MKIFRKTAFGAIAVLLSACAIQSLAEVRITEVAPWASGNTLYANDWFELTNIGASALSIAGWRMDDSSANFGSAVAMTGVASIAAGESVIFIENAAGNAGFLGTWFGATVPSGLQIGNYAGGGVGLSTGGDAVTIFDGSGVVQASVSFGAADSRSPYQTFDNAARLNGVAISQLGAAGVNGAFVAFSDAGEIGSPGRIDGMAAAVPEPETYALMLAGLAVVGSIKRRRQR